MKTTWKFFSIMLLVSVSTIGYYSCKKDVSASSPAQQKVSLYLTDDPGFFDKVLIDIQSVALLTDTCSKHDDWEDEDHDRDHDHDGDEHPEKKSHCVIWDSLQIRAGVYDLLTLSNGVDTMLATGSIPKGNIKLIRIGLGNGSALVKNGITYPLNLFPGSKNYVYIKLHGNEWDEFENGHSRLWLDFDISRSVVQVHDGAFYLRPVFHWFTKKSTGAVKGRALPMDAYPVISVYSGSDTTYALPNREGQFKVHGLKDGTYGVFINASNGYKDTTISNVTVKAGKEADLGTINLHK